MTLVSRRTSTVVGVALVSVLTIGYVAVLGYFGVLGLSGGTAVSVAFGAGCLFFAITGAWAVVAEVLFGFRSTRLLDRLTEVEGLPTDGLPVTVSGRTDEAAAKAIVADFRAAAIDPAAGWKEKLRYAVIADAAGDRRAARRATVAAIRANRQSER